MSTRTDDDVRREIEAERERLANSVESLRDVAGKLKSKLPLVAAGALGAGFVIAGGLSATARLIFRRGRE